MAAEWHTQGLQWLLETAFSEEQSVPVNFYAGLCTDASLAETAVLGDQTDVTGSGMSRQPIASTAVGFISAATGTNDRKVTTIEVTFTATGTWTGAKTAFLTTTINDTGVLVVSEQLSETITLVNNGTLKHKFELTAIG